MSHKGEIQVHVHHHLGVEGRLVAYQLVGPMWQLNVINVHVPFGDATETFLEHVMEAYRELAMMGPTVIIGHFNAAPSADDRRGQPTPEGSGASGHATSGPAGPHSLSTRPALTQTTTALHGRFPHRPLLRRLGTRRVGAGAIPRPAIQDHRTSTPGDTNQGTSGTPDLQGWHGPRRATTHQAARIARHPQMGSVLPQGTTHPGPARQNGPQPRHATGSHSMRPQQTTQNTGRYHPASRPTIPGHNHMARQASTAHSSALA